MKGKSIILTIAIFAVISISTSFGKSRIGVYDSRCIAIMYAQSEEFGKNMNELMDSFKKAKESNDTILVKQLEEKGQLTQRVLHDKGFGRGSVAEILENRQTELQALAKKEKLIAIVSKWEVNYSNPDVELVDITILMLKEFKAPEHIIKMCEEMQKSAPIKDAFFIND